MKVIVLALLVSLCGLSEIASAQEQRTFDRGKLTPQNLDAALKNGYTAGSVGADVVQAAAQVVARKAKRAAWGILRDKLIGALHCDHATTPMAQTCAVVKTIDIKELISSPRTLLDAAVADLLAIAKAKLPTLTTTSAELIDDVIVGWKQGRVDGVLALLRDRIQDELRATIGPSCPASDLRKQALWVVAACVIEVGSADFTTCDLQKYVDACDLGGGDADIVAQANMARRRLSVLGGRALGKDSAALVELAFTMLVDTADQEKFAGIKDAVLGLVDHDWIKVTHGFVSVIARLAATPCPAGATCAALPDHKLFRLLAAVGQYADTYKSKDGDGGAEARAKVIEDLLETMVSRTDRDRGAVVSLGGSLALMGGVRFHGDAYQAAWPVRLPLGLALQTYGAGKRGFHLTIDVLDVGEYVTYDSNDLDVAAPDLKSSVIVGGSIGMWFLDRETPMFVAARGAVSPFVRDTSGKRTYEAGVSFGVYVPLLDLN